MKRKENRTKRTLSIFFNRHQKFDEGFNLHGAIERWKQIKGQRSVHHWSKKSLTRKNLTELRDDISKTWFKGEMKDIEPRYLRFLWKHGYKLFIEAFHKAAAGMKIQITKKPININAAYDG